jgi:DNA-binding GntR family transcriptional regulator
LSFGQSFSYTFRVHELEPQARALTKTELIHGMLRHGILSLKYRPGDYLNIDDLARRHGISPIPVREAVARLVAERLVVVRPHVGAEVAPLDDTSVREIFALLGGLETSAVGDIVARATVGDIVALRGIHAEMEQLSLPDDLASWDRANAAFHLKLASIAQLPSVSEHLGVVFDHWDRARKFFFEIAPRRDAGKAQREHLAMIGALETGDADRLHLLLHQHNERARQVYLKLLASRGRPLPGPHAATGE